MVLTTTPYTDETLAIAGTQLHLLKGGSGRPALVLHGIEGPEGWLQFHDLALAAGDGLRALPSRLRTSPSARTGSRASPTWRYFYERFLRESRPRRRRPHRLRPRRLGRGRDGGDVLPQPRPPRPRRLRRHPAADGRDPRHLHPLVGRCRVVLRHRPRGRRGVPAHLRRRTHPGLRRRAARPVA